MNTKKLKQLVLDLAIHGKLVPQDPNDEPASELLKRIQAEKAKSAKGKKSAVSSVDLDEVPFEVPEGWCWTRLIEVCSVFSTGPFGSMVHKSDYVFDKGVPLINPANIKDGKIDSDKLMFVSEAKSIELSRYRLSVNDVLLARRGDLSKCAIVSSKEENWLCGTGSFFLRLILIQPEFFLSFYSTNYLQSILSSESVGATMDNLNQGLLGNVLFPLPPLAEQHRIVAAIEKWFAVIDQLEKNEADLKKSIEQTKKKVLDLAIRGKLVAQNPEDEPAGELLARIRADVETHGRASNKAKGKKASAQEVELDEGAFEIPDNWTWCSITDVAVDDLGKTLDREKNKGAFNPYLRSANVFWGRFDFSDLKEMKFEDSELEFYSLKKGDLMVCEGGDIGRSAVWEDERPMFFQNALHRIRFNNGMNPYFFLYVLQHYKNTNVLEDFSQGVTIKHLTKSSLSKIPFPLPPLAEQKRIVAKIEEVFGVLERIEGMM